MAPVDVLKKCQARKRWVYFPLLLVFLSWLPDQESSTRTRERGASKREQLREREAGIMGPAYQRRGGGGV